MSQFRFRFRLRTLLFFTALVAILFAHVSWHRLLSQRETVFLKNCRPFRGTGQIYQVGYADAQSAPKDRRWDISCGACGLPRILCRITGGDQHHIVLLGLWNQVASDSIEGLSNLRQLRGLIIEDTVQPYEQELLELTDLHYLCLHATDATDYTVSCLRGMDDLRILRLGHTDVSDQSVDVLSQLTQLRQLSIHRTQISDQGLRRLTRALPDCEIQD